MFGQIVSGIYGDEWESPSTTLEHFWTNTLLLRLRLAIHATDWLTLKFGGELYMQNTQSKYFKIYKDLTPEVESTIHWAFDIPVLTSLEIQTGISPYMFDPEVKTLGNYLFRSTVHPVSVQNRVDYPWTDLLGGVGEVGLFDNRIKFQAIISTELNYIPLYDCTPALALCYKPKNEIIDIGGAIAFHRAIQSNYARMADSLHKKWRGTKLDFRAIFEPKPIFGAMDFLPKNQMKMYAELAFIGLKDSLEVDTSNLANLRSQDSSNLKDLAFPANSLLHRMPFMIGLNLPTWKIFDLFAIEFEWFYSPYANDWFGKFMSKRRKHDSREVCSNGTITSTKIISNGPYM